MTIREISLSKERSKLGGRRRYYLFGIDRQDEEDVHSSVSLSRALTGLTLVPLVLVPQSPLEAIGLLFGQIDRPPTNPNQSRPLPLPNVNHPAP